MGKGKAEPEFWAAKIKEGTVLYELAGVPKDVARSALLRVAHKMPFKGPLCGTPPRLIPPGSVLR